MRILYLVDPLESLKPPTDTSLLLIREGMSRRHVSETAEHKDLRVIDGTAAVFSQRTAVDGKGRGVPMGAPRPEALSEFDAIVFRHDPPFDVEYLHATQIVELSGHRNVLNSARGIRRANEKLYAMHFAPAMPETIVTSRLDEAMHFIKECGAAVGKPLDSFGGIGVVLIRAKDTGARSLVDILTAEGRRQAIFQRYVKGVDKRIFIIDNRVEGVMIRKGPKTDFRQNMHVGGQPTLGELSPIEKKRIDMILPKLKEDGLDFVGVDLIGGFLSEINVTSPTGFWHFRKVSRRMLTKEVMDMLERRRS